jgi:hypothetical protein
MYNIFAGRNVIPGRYENMRKINGILIAALFIVNIMAGVSYGTDISNVVSLDSPVVEITSPSNGSIIMNPNIIVQGNALADFPLVEYGYIIEYPGGGIYSESWDINPPVEFYDFSIFMILVEGSEGNLITVYVKDTENNEGSDSILVFYNGSGNNPPEPTIVFPEEDSFISKSTEIRVGELNNRLDDILFVDFYIIVNGDSDLIGTDDDNSDGWSLDLPLYLLRDYGIQMNSHFSIEAVMVSADESTGFDRSSYIYDVYPPLPIFQDLQYPSEFSGEVYLNVDTDAEDIDHGDFFIMNRSYKDKRNKMEKLKETVFGVNVGTDPYAGFESCGPAASASCLSYWDQYIDADGNKPYDNLYDESIIDNDQDGYPDGLEQMARDLYDDCMTNGVYWNDTNGNGQQDDGELNLNGEGVRLPGTDDGLLHDGIVKYLTRKGLNNNLGVTYYGPKINQQPADMKKMWEEFMRCQDVIPLFEHPGPDGDFNTTGDNKKHYATMSYADWGSTQIPLYTNCQVKLMDPDTGNHLAGAANLNENSSYYGRVYADWNGDGDIGPNEYARLISFNTVCPKEFYNGFNYYNNMYGNWVYIGSDDSGNDGWGITWDTTLVDDGYYLGKVVFVDDSGNYGDGVTLLGKVENRNDPPSAPTIDGASSGKAGETYTYIISSIDPDDDMVSYLIDWGDGNESGWLGPYDSGSEINLSHVWVLKNEYVIKVKAKDSHDQQSDWTILEVSIPKNKQVRSIILRFLQNHPYFFPLLRQLLK